MSSSAPGSITLAARFVEHAGATSLERLYESGGLRLRRPRGPTCEGIIVNTAGGIVADDRLRLEIAAGAGAEVTLTTVAAEKIYRSEHRPAQVSTSLELAARAQMFWLPQETILFDGARLERRFDLALAADSRLVAVEMLVFGRLASGETAISGSLDDRWHVRRDGRLVFADATRLEGAVGATLDRPAIAAGARAAALLLVVAPDAEARLDPLREALAAHAEVEAGASVRDGILVARALARSPERLRAAIVAVLGLLRAGPLPRVWR